MLSLVYKAPTMLTGNGVGLPPAGRSVEVAGTVAHSRRPKSEIGALKLTSPKARKTLFQSKTARTTQPRPNPPCSHGPPRYKNGALPPKIADRQDLTGDREARKLIEEANLP